MGKSDVEMEDAEEHFHGSGSDVKQSETEVFDGKIEYEGENISPVATNSGDSNKCGNVEEDMIKLRNEAKDQATDKSEIVEQSSLERETNQPMTAEESTEQQIYSKNETEQSSINIIGGDKHAARSTVEKQTGSTDATNKVIEQNGINGHIKQESSSETGVEGRNPVQKVIEENPSGDVAAEKHKDTGKEDENCVEHVASKEVTNENADTGNDPKENRPELSCNEAPKSENVVVDMFLRGNDRELEDAANVKEGKAVNDGPREQCENIQLASPITDGDAKTVETSTKHEGDGFSLPNQHEAAATPNSLIRYSVAKAADHTEESVKTAFTQVAQPLMAEDDDGTPEDQEAFMKELESFYRERAMDFKPPKFYGQPLNCLKLWRAVLRLGGYDRVTGSKLWRQVGESFHPPKTCTTVSWTFRIFYEKSLLEYEKHKRQSGELQLPVATLPEASGADNEGNGHLGSGSGRARSDSAARAMQGRHAQRLFGYGEDKSLGNVGKREKIVKSIGSLKQKRPNEVEHSIKAARTETSKQLATSVVDVGPPADWVKINVRQTNDCFEVYALVPGLLREEVRVQSDPAGRVVITGQPEQADNPWGITPFKKVVSLPTRIDPLQTSAVVSLHGRLFVRAPFEQPNI